MVNFVFTDSLEKFQFYDSTLVVLYFSDCCQTGENLYTAILLDKWRDIKTFLYTNKSQILFA